MRSDFDLQSKMILILVLKICRAMGCKCGGVKSSTINESFIWHYIIKLSHLGEGWGSLRKNSRIRKTKG